MRAATADKVWSAAVALFARQGFAATSMRDIARAAGISTGLIYRHYETKEHLFGALVTGAADGLGRVADAFRSDGSPTALVRQFTEEVLADIAADHGFPAFLFIMNEAFGWQEGSAQVRSLQRQHAALMEATADLIRRGQQLGEFRRGDPDELATCYFAALGGLATMKRTPHHRFVMPSADMLTAFMIGERDGR